MKFILSFLFLSTSALLCFSQIREDKLVIGINEAFELTGTDIIVVDTLIMLDSSKIILNSEKSDNFIHAKIVKIGIGCQIIGEGSDGLDGVVGLSGYTPIGPCKNGIPGRSGTAGTSARDGINLYLYFDMVTIKGSLQVELSGGNGGDGGRGGNGGGGSPGTRLCQGGDGGIGGNGADGGNGGNGGNLTISCKTCPDLRGWLGNKINVRSYGGNAGLGGDGGLGGLAGLVSAGKTLDGEQGAKGKPGISGDRGRNGAINFEQL
ncbi:MAG TPA: hypothetical protein VIS49_04520 [Cyclobacteriaceae bacterium]